ncbi:DUF3911 family protein [Bacillus sp. D-CC]
MTEPLIDASSIDIHSNTSSAQDTLNDQFVSQMLTGVYND